MVRVRFRTVLADKRQKKNSTNKYPSPERDTTDDLEWPRPGRGNMEATTAPEMPWPSIASNAPTDGEVQARLRRDLLRHFFAQGKELHFLAPAALLQDLEHDATLERFVPRSARWPLRPLGPIARSARKAMAEVVKSGELDRSILGMLCLPNDLAQQLCDPQNRGKICLVLEGIHPSDPDETLAITGMADLARRVGADLLLIP